MHDIGMNTAQLEMSVAHIDEAIALSHAWTQQLLDATENYSMDRIGAKLEACLAALDDARGALEGYTDAIEADHNAVGSVKLV